jgi:phosphoglycerol transferase MdoB-like AlkP superfamily enzyme
LGAWLPTLEQKSKPWFLGVYNLGTHAFIDVASDEEKYGNGENHTINTIHNFDTAFGNFWNDFQKTPMAKNTIIIITADHAHYPEESYRKIVTDPEYQKLFIDQIPFDCFTIRRFRTIVNWMFKMLRLLILHQQCLSI